MCPLPSHHRDLGELKETPANGRLVSETEPISEIVKMIALKRD